MAESQSEKKPPASYRYYETTVTIGDGAYRAIVNAIFLKKPKRVEALGLILLLSLLLWRLIERNLYVARI